MPNHSRDDNLYVIGVSEDNAGPNITRIVFHTTRGDIIALARFRHGIHRGVILLGGVSADTDKSDCMFTDIADCLLRRKINSLQLYYRNPGDCIQCSIDTLLACQYFDDEGVSDIALVGWSFGGAIAISVGSVARNVRAVAAGSVMDVDDCCVRRLKNKPLLLIHGDADAISPIEIPNRIYMMSGGSRRLLVYNGVGHGMEQARDRLNNDLIKWISRNFSP